MNENRRQILEMLSAGKITADEAERLISAVEKEPSTGAPRPTFRAASQGQAEIHPRGGG